MKTIKANSRWVTARKMVPITEFIPVPENVVITPEQLELSDLSGLPRRVTLLVTADPLEIRITKVSVFSITVVRKIQPDEPLAQKYGARMVAKTMANATGFFPNDEHEAKRLPDVRSASWHLPDEVDWRFDLPIQTTGIQILDLARASGEFFLKVTGHLLTPESKVQEVAAQI